MVFFCMSVRVLILTAIGRCAGIGLQVIHRGSQDLCNYLCLFCKGQKNVRSWLNSVCTNQRGNWRKGGLSPWQSALPHIPYLVNLSSPEKWRIPEIKTFSRRTLTIINNPKIGWRWIRNIILSFSFEAKNTFFSPVEFLTRRWNFYLQDRSLITLATSATREGGGLDIK